MSKRARLHIGSGGDEPSAKRCRTAEGDDALPPALYDAAAWDILTQFLTSSMSMSEMDDMLVSYLGDRYHEDDWVEPRHLLFSGNRNDAESLRNLKLLKIKLQILPPRLGRRRWRVEMDTHAFENRISDPK
ncbi:hypothetical protein F4604DRAFT_1686131 [Suillus subluteus]|nr:hypothetical protein F4604DRAFT_1686131 [Suillus subluteus]